MSNPKLILFDIDGTLISTHGIPRQAMTAVLKRRYTGFSFDNGFNFSGRTDWEIIEHMLVFDRREVNRDLIFQIFDDFANELEVQLLNGRIPTIYTGIEALLSSLHQTKNVFLGLVTGNIQRGARIKLQAAGLFNYFATGGFGDDSKDRNDLPPIAIQRSEKLYNLKFKPDNTWIIGDSIYDIHCARANRLRCLAVSTGWTAYAELQQTLPDHLYKNLVDTPAIIELLLSD